MDGQTRRSQDRSVRDWGMGCVFCFLGKLGRRSSLLVDSRDDRLTVTTVRIVLQWSVLLFIEYVVELFVGFYEEEGGGGNKQ